MLQERGEHLKLSVRLLWIGRTIEEDGVEPPQLANEMRVDLHSLAHMKLNVLHQVRKMRFIVALYGGVYVGISFNGMENSESIIMECLTDEVSTASALPRPYLKHRFGFHLADRAVQQLSVCNP